MNLFQKTARPRYIFISLALVIIFLALLIHFIIRLYNEEIKTVLDIQPAFTYREAFDQIDQYTQKGIGLYTAFQNIDFFFQICYGLFFVSLIGYLIIRLFPGFLKKHPALLNLSAFGIAAALADFSENIGIFIMIRIHPAPYDILSAAVSIMGIIKIILFYGCVLACIGGSITLVVKRIHQKQRVNLKV